VETGKGADLILAPKTEFSARFFGAGGVMSCKILQKREDGIEVLSPMGVLIVPLLSDYNPAKPRLFIPRDALSFEENRSAAGRKSINVRVTGTRFEGTGTIFKLLPLNQENYDGNTIEPVPFEAGAGPRIKPPASGSIISLWIDQSLLKFVSS
jgi:ABC-type Fe3+/spermidine/putrescine transport system ATPase subunit